MTGLSDLKTHTGDIDKFIERVFREFRQELSGIEISDESRWALSVYQEYANRPGKRIRASLALELSKSRMAVEQPSEAAYYLAVAIELMHDYLLIVDDVMDKSPMRRGEPTIHELYKQQFRDFSPSQFDANMAAINIGYMLQHVASWALAQAESLSDVQAGSLQSIMHRNIFITGLGQMDDISVVAKALTSRQSIVDKYYKKSSYYTFVNPLMLALALSGDCVSEVKPQVEAFGLPAGLTFQLRDDWLGIFGDAGQSGKSNLDDIREGKITLLLQSAKEAADELRRSELDRIIGNEQASDKDLQIVRDIFTQTGAVKVNQQAATEAADQAIRAARQAECWDEPFADLLVELVKYSLEREK